MIEKENNEYNALPTKQEKYEERKLKRKVCLMSCLAVVKKEFLLDFICF